MTSSNWAPFACLLITIGIIGFVGFIVFPIWAAVYAARRGHTLWAIVTAISIWFGFGLFPGLVAWLVSRHSPVVRNSTVTARPSPARYPTPGSVRYGTRIDDSPPASARSASASYSSAGDSGDSGEGVAWKERLERQHEKEEERDRDRAEQREREEREADDWAREERYKQEEADDYYRQQEEEKWQRVEDERQERLHDKYYGSDDDE